MVNQIIGDLSVFKLTKQEKVFFYKVVNKLSREIYERGETNSGLFLKAIEDGNAEEAYKCIQGLLWRCPAIKILREVKKISKLKEKKRQESQLEWLCNLAYTYGTNDSLPSIIHCSECGEVMISTDLVCPSCGNLVDE